MTTEAKIDVRIADLPIIRRAFDAVKEDVTTIADNNAEIAGAVEKICAAIKSIDQRLAAVERQRRNDDAIAKSMMAEMIHLRDRVEKLESKAASTESLSLTQSKVARLERVFSERHYPLFKMSEISPIQPAWSDWWTKQLLTKAHYDIVTSFAIPASMLHGRRADIIVMDDPLGYWPEVCDTPWGEIAWSDAPEMP